MMKTKASWQEVWRVLLMTLLVFCVLVGGMLRPAWRLYCSVAGDLSTDQRLLAELKAYASAGTEEADNVNAGLSRTPGRGDLSGIQEMAERSRVEVVRLRSKKSRQADGPVSYSKVPLQMTLIGQETGMVKFLERLLDGRSRHRLVRLKMSVDPRQPSGIHAEIDVEKIGVL